MRERFADAQADAVGADVFAVSSATGDGLDALVTYLAAGQTVAMIGPSGAGKSTLTNALGAGTFALQTGAVRDDGKGRHTTTARELVVLPSGAVAIDTPGLRGLALWEAEEGIGAAFSDIVEFAADCRFADCAHHTEPGCAVGRAIAEGDLDVGRFADYEKLLREQRRLETRRDGRARALEDAPAKVFYKAVKRHHIVTLDQCTEFVRLRGHDAAASRNPIRADDEEKRARDGRDAGTDLGGRHALLLTALAIVVCSESIISSHARFSERRCRRRGVGLNRSNGARDVLGRLRTASREGLDLARHHGKSSTRVTRPSSFDRRVQGEQFVCPAIEPIKLLTAPIRSLDSLRRATRSVADVPNAPHPQCCRRQWPRCSRSPGCCRSAGRSRSRPRMPVRHLGECICQKVCEHGERLGG